jgi:hypothetical protein
MCGRPRQRIREKEKDVAGGMGRTVRPPPHPNSTQPPDRK